MKFTLTEYGSRHPKSTHDLIVGDTLTITGVDGKPALEIKWSERKQMDVRLLAPFISLDESLKNAVLWEKVREALEGERTDGVG